MVKSTSRSDRTSSRAGGIAANDRRSCFAAHGGQAELCRGLALVGYMGAGKTTVGRALAERIGWRFDDLDSLIEQHEGRRVEEIFARQGESAFRQLEGSLLRDRLRQPGAAVLALGGGAFLEIEVQKLLTEAQIPAVFLDAPLEELFRRCLKPGAVRPLRGDVEQFRELYERRRPTYLKAVLCVQTGGKAVGEIVEEIISRLNLPFPRSG